MAQSIKFKTKNEANKRLKLMQSDKNLFNCEVEKIKGDNINKGYIVKFNTQNK